MNLITRPREEPQVNLTSLIDVVLLLLVFFMVTTSFVRESSVSVQLPEASPEPTASVDDNRLEITITASGDYYVDNRPLINKQRQTLTRALEQVASGRQGLALTIVADADASHQSVITAMDVAGKLGFTSISIATLQPSND
ncbi:MAG: biopolymer transporter ExbD [Pseudomonadota bacterium]